MDHTIARLSVSFILCMVVGLLSCARDHTTAPEVTPPAADTSAAPAAASVILSMGTGFNLGNTFDLAQHPTMLESITPIIDLYYYAGMQHVRIPVTWMDGFGGNTLANANGIINYQHPRFLQLKAVIQYALERKMFVVINAHHEHWLKDHYDGSAPYDTAFATLWRGIATYFRDYSDHLIFEVLNEPEGAFGDWNGGPTPTNAQALAWTRKINEIGYKAIRATGGRNRTRTIMISTNGQGNQSQIDEVYPNKASLPGGGADSCLAIQVHTYDPWSFCGQTGKNTAWPGSATLAAAVKAVAAHSRLLGVPVNYGEFGVGRESNTSERNSNVVREYYRTMRVTIISEGMSATIWDDRGWFGLIVKNGAAPYDFLYGIVPSMMAP